ncbi:MAG: alpha/beta fold hydrolase [Labilithrix sp.]|nr:alpha/beta fold hydrolase [Labilithrix sp.]
MKHPSFLLGALAVSLASAGLVASCVPDNFVDPVLKLQADSGGGGAQLTPSVGCSDTVDSIYGDPGPLSADPATRGNIIKCTKDPDLTKEAIQAKVTEIGYAGKPMTSGAKVYRVSYRTERGDAASTPAVSSAIVYLPDTPRAEKLPVVVAARGSRGQGPQCAVSKFDPSQPGINADAYRLVYPLVGQGYAVILSDLAGYANFGAPNNPPSAYAQATDVARSTLDSGRALKKLVPALDERVVLVGHSQGGFTALASLATAEAYGTAGPIIGTAVYAPLWLSQRVAGALLIPSLGNQFPIDTSAVPAVSVLYHYTEAELLDGPGEGKKLFKADKADAIEAYVKTSCWEQNREKLEPLGKFAFDYFDQAFIDSVSKPALGTLGPCPAADALCQKWLARYTGDRPHLTGAAKTTPILIAYGGADTTLAPTFFKCGLDRLGDDGANVSVCVDPAKGHSDIVSSKAEYVADWIASVALGAPAPAPCAAGAEAVTASCFTPPPND